MRNLEKRIGKLEAQRRDNIPVLIAVSPDETNEEAVARSGKDKASLAGRTVFFVRTGVPRPDAD